MARQELDECNENSAMEKEEGGGSTDIYTRSAEAQARLASTLDIRNHTVTKGMHSTA
jgi:hypothetical protein